MKDRKRISTFFARDWLPCLILLLYPMRHVNWGLDLWDTGYNYANFQYMGLDHMDSMWFYSTYLATAVGNFLTKLPFGDCLVGMNVYTGLFVSFLGVLGYWFCTRKLQIPRWIAFLGEMLALSLCWCPTALLYNYLTYVFFTLCVILLYLGLTKNNMRYLFFAGVFLGLNVLVRFSNLPEAALILAVWFYAVLEWREERQTAGTAKNFRERICRCTGWCLGGYLAALAVLLLYIQIRYGLDSYGEGILRLFAMTDNNTQYKPTAMIMGIVGEYVRNLYWVIRLLVLAGAGMLGFGGGKTILETKRVKGLRAGSRAWQRLCGLAEGVLTGACGLLFLATLGWLYYREFCSLAFYSYDSMLRPGILFLMLTMGAAGVRVLQPSSAKEEKLLGVLVILVVLLTSIGSNNGVYPSMNHLFVAAPYTLWQCWQFFTGAKEHSFVLRICPLPAKAVLGAFLALCLFQFFGFGANFAFAESTGVQQITDRVENNEVLRGVKMSPEKARWMEEITAYVKEAGLEGREVILYGKIPALSYYLQMPSAFNPWSDLASYRPEAFAQALGETVREMEPVDNAKRPVVILENRYVQYLTERGAASEERLQEMKEDEKWLLLSEFLDQYGYQLTFSNEKFGVFE